MGESGISTFRPAKNPMPEKNHYFPIFYQKRWAGDDGQVCLYSKPHWEVKAIRRHPSRIGFQYDLYTIPGVEHQTSKRLWIM
jgi:Protein of unknown function (DUF4238)